MSSENESRIATVKPNGYHYSNGNESHEEPHREYRDSYGKRNVNQSRNAPKNGNEWGDKDKVSDAEEVKHPRFSRAKHRAGKFVRGGTKEYAPEKKEEVPEGYRNRTATVRTGLRGRFSGSPEKQWEKQMMQEEYKKGRVRGLTSGAWYLGRKAGSAESGFGRRRQGTSSGFAPPQSGMFDYDWFGSNNTPRANLSRHVDFFGNGNGLHSGFNLLQGQLNFRMGSQKGISLPKSTRNQLNFNVGLPRSASKQLGFNLAFPKNKKNNPWSF